MNNDAQKFNDFLKAYDACFADSTPNKVTPPRAVDDHRIDLIYGSAPPNRAPYCVSLAQQEEIMSQVNELLERGMIRPSFSPFCSPVL